MKLRISLLALALTLLTGCAPDQPALPTQAFLTSPQAYEGHEYSLSASIVEQAIASTKGAVIIVQSLEGGVKLPLIKPKQNSTEFYPEQKYGFVVKVTNGNLIIKSAQKL